MFHKVHTELLQTEQGGGGTDSGPHCLQGRAAPHLRPGGNSEGVSHQDVLVPLHTGGPLGERRYQTPHISSPLFWMSFIC